MREVSADAEAENAAGAGAVMAAGAASSSIVAQGFAVGAGLTGMVVPGDLHALLDALDDPVRVSDEVIRIQLPLRRLVALLAPEAEPELSAIPQADELDGDVTIDLTSGPGGRLDRMRTTVRTNEDGETSLAVDDLRFTRWDESLDLTAPGDDRIDHTPSFDEEALAGATFPLLAPTQVPVPYRLVEASYSGVDAENDGSCPSAYLRYTDPAEEQAYEKASEALPPDVSEEAFQALPLVRSLDITLSAVDCTADDEWSGRDDEEAAEEFVVGGVRGTIVRTDDEQYGSILDIVLEVDCTRLDIRADLPEDQAVAALSSLGPLDLATQPVTELRSS